MSLHIAAPDPVRATLGTEQPMLQSNQTNPLSLSCPAAASNERCLAAEQLDDDRPVLRAGGEQFLRRAGALVGIEPLGADPSQCGADRRAPNPGRHNRRIRRASPTVRPAGRATACRERKREKQRRSARWPPSVALSAVGRVSVPAARRGLRTICTLLLGQGIDSASTRKASPLLNPF